MYVLVNEFVEVSEVYRLQKTTGDGPYPEVAVEPFHREEVRQWAVASLGDDIDGVAVFEGVKNVSNVWMAQ